MKKIAQFGILTALFAATTTFAAPKKKVKAPAPAPAPAPVQLAQPVAAPVASNDSRFMNLSIDPIGFVFGAFDITAEFALGNRFALGPTIGYGFLSSGSDKAHLLELGAHGTAYLSGEVFHDSWIVSPIFNWVHASLNDKSASAFNIEAVIGYNWVWDSGFNMTFAGGIAYDSLDFTQLGAASISGVLPALEFRLGYAF